MALLTKKSSALTQKDNDTLRKPVGTKAFPYPATFTSINPTDNTKVDIEVGVVADDNHPLPIYSERPYEYVIGEMYRKMAVPSLLKAQEQMLRQRVPESKKRVLLIVGEPGTGKSHGAKTIADICDERGAEVIDCGGRYMADLLWEQVIDYGEDFKTALTERIKGGHLSAKSIEVMKEQFPDALLRDDKEEITGIDWDKTATSRVKGQTKDGKDIYESSAEAVERVMQLMETVAKFEGIPLQASNSIGIKKVPGIIKRCHDEGRTLILDEYTKSVEGSDDALQTMLQYLNGEIDEVTVTNSMKVAGREETYSYTLRRDDMKAGFFTYMTGNNQEDGVSTHMLSKSAYSRLPKSDIKNLSLADWKHRISQVMTGLPLSTLYFLFSDVGQKDSDEFSRMMLDLRTLGLSAQEQERIPQQQLTLIRNWEDTLEAVDKLARFYMTMSNLVNPDSDLYDYTKYNDRSIPPALSDIMAEISPSFRDECAIDFRKVIQDIGEALQPHPAIRPVMEGDNLHIDFSAFSRGALAPQQDSPDVLASKFGTRLEEVLLDRIADIGRGHPRLMQQLLVDSRNLGIITTGGNAKNMTISQLLNKDAYSAFGGVEKVQTMREALTEQLKRLNPGLRQKPDDDIMDMEQAVQACEDIDRLVLRNDEGQIVNNKSLIIADGSLSNIFNEASAVDGAVAAEKPAPEELVSTTEFLGSLAIPGLSEVDRNNIWSHAISEQNLLGEPTPETTPIVKIAECEGEVGITTLMLRAADGQGTAPMYVLRDSVRDKRLLVTDHVDDELKKALEKDFTVVSYKEAGAEEQVKTFIREMLEDPSRAATAGTLEQQLTYAFMLRAGNQNEVQPLAKLMTTADLRVDAPVYIVKGAPQ